MSGENGIGNEGCDRARARYGLPALFHSSLPVMTESYPVAGASEPPEHTIDGLINPVLSRSVHVYHGKLVIP